MQYTLSLHIINILWWGSLIFITINFELLLQKNKKMAAAKELIRLKPSLPIDGIMSFQLSETDYFSKTISKLLIGWEWEKNVDRNQLYLLRLLLQRLWNSLGCNNKVINNLLICIFVFDLQCTKQKNISPGK